MTALITQGLAIRDLLPLSGLDIKPLLGSIVGAITPPVAVSFALLGYPDATVVLSQPGNGDGTTDVTVTDAAVVDGSYLSSDFDRAAGYPEVLRAPSHTFDAGAGAFGTDTVTVDGVIMAPADDLPTAAVRWLRDGVEVGTGLSRARTGADAGRELAFEITYINVASATDAFDVVAGSVVQAIAAVAYNVIHEDVFDGTSGTGITTLNSESVLVDNASLSTGYSAAPGSIYGGPGGLVMRDSSNPRNGSSLVRFKLTDGADLAADLLLRLAVRARDFSNPASAARSTLHCEFFDDALNVVSECLPPVIIGGNDFSAYDGDFYVTVPAGVVGVQFRIPTEASDFWDGNAIVLNTVLFAGPSGLGASVGLAPDQFNLNGTVITVRDANDALPVITQLADGQFQIASDTDVTLSYSTAGDTLGGKVINGATLRLPANGDQGFDERARDFDPALHMASPATLSPGETPLFVRSGQLDNPAPSNNERRQGLFDLVGQVTIVSVANAGDATALSAPAVWWTGRALADTAVDGPYDWAAMVAAIPRYAVSGTTALKSAAAILSTLTYAPTMANNRAASNGYEFVLPTQWLGGDNTYGERLAEGLEEIVLMLLVDDPLYSEADRITALQMLMAFGKQITDPWLNGAGGYGANGGHYIIQHPAAVLYLKLSGQEALIPTVATGGMMGNMDQAFVVTQNMIDNDFVPHATSAGITYFRQREVTAIDVAQNRVDFATYGNETNTQLQAREGLMRTLGGFSAVVTSQINSRGPSSVNLQNGHDSFVDVDDVAGLSVGDFIYFDAALPIVAGDVWWSVKKYDNQPEFFVPTPHAAYWFSNFDKNQKWSGGVLLLHAVGAWSADWQAVLDFVIRSNDTADFPTTHHTSDMVRLWDQRSAAILALPQLS